MTNKQKETSGVPPGSNLEQLLNSIYVNDLPSSLKLLILQCLQSIQTHFLNIRT